MKDFFSQCGDFFRITAQSVSYALSSLSKNRLRSFLSLLGVSIGIFCITAAMSIVDSLENTLKDSFKSFGGNAVFVEKIPLEPDLNEEGVFRWWKYASRPEPDYQEYLFLKERLSDEATVAFSARYEDGSVVGVSQNWDCLVKNPLASGRGFSNREISEGAAVALVGADVAEADSSLTIYVCSKAVKVVGRLEKSGMASVDMYDCDNAVFVPYLWARKNSDMKSSRHSITVLAKENVDENFLLSDIETALRARRKLRSGEASDFSLNRLSFVIREVEHLSEVIGTIVWIIGLFSLLVGGFSVANIMFVAVKERTCEIGLQKALGARRSVILFQYLAESSLLSLLGGGAGIALAGILGYFLPTQSLEIGLSATTVFKSLATALSIGLISGLSPAISAANLPPALALNKK